MEEFHYTYSFEQCLQDMDFRPDDSVFQQKFNQDDLFSQKVEPDFEMNQINEEAPFRQKENLIIDYFNQTSTSKFSEFQSQSKRD